MHRQTRLSSLSVSGTCHTFGHLVRLNYLNDVHSVSSTCLTMKVCVGAHVGTMLGTLSMVQPLVSGVAAAFRQLGLQYLTLHKAVAKLGYIVTSLLSGVMQEGFCTATESEETEAGGRGFTGCSTGTCISQVHCLSRWDHFADCGVVMCMHA